jgi:hypothetical protein
MKLLLGVVLAIGLSSCATINNLETIASGSVSPQQVYIAANSFDAIEATATQYLKLPLCPQGSPVCRTQLSSQTVYNNVKTARSARNALEAYMNANPGASVPVSNYNVLVTSVQTLNALVAVNKGG